MEHFDTRDFSTYYGGRAMTPDKPPLIHAAFRALRAYIGSIPARPSKEEFGPKFPVKSSRELCQKLAQGLNDLNLVCYVVAQQHTHPPAPFTWTDRNGRSGTGTMVHVTSIVRLAAEDGSFVDFVGSGHGQDRDDKAGGKASTYAWKDAILKGLCLPEVDIEDTDNEVGTGTGASLGGSPSRDSESQSAPGKREDTGPANTLITKRGRAPAVAAFDEVSEIAARLSAAATLEELYKIRDNEIKPLSLDLQKTLTPAYVARRDALK